MLGFSNFISYCRSDVVLAGEGYNPESFYLAGDNT